MRSRRGAAGAFAVGVLVLTSMMAGCTFFGEGGWVVTIYRDSSQEEERIRFSRSFEVDDNVTWREPFSSAVVGYHGAIAAGPFTMVVESPQAFEVKFSLRGGEGGPREPSNYVRLTCDEGMGNASREDDAIHVSVNRTTDRCTYRVDLGQTLEYDAGPPLLAEVEYAGAPLERVRLVVAFEDGEPVTR